MFAPARHVGAVHTPSSQLLPEGHTRPHAPQLFRSVLLLVSQPSACTPLQSAKPALQLAILHAPAKQAGTPLGTEHTLPHRPQLAVLVRSASHPFDARPSQSANPATHVKPQALPLHVGVACAGVGHTAPHAPHDVVVFVVFTSQPLAALASQSAKPDAHADTVHNPPAQPGVALARLQAFPHAPQAVGVVSNAVSQPFADVPSQSA